MKSRYVRSTTLSMASSFSSTATFSKYVSNYYFTGLNRSTFTIISSSSSSWKEYFFLRLW